MTSVADQRASRTGAGRASHLTSAATAPHRKTRPWLVVATLGAAALVSALTADVSTVVLGLYGLAALAALMNRDREARPALALLVVLTCSFSVLPNNAPTQFFTSVPLAICAYLILVAMTVARTKPRTRTASGVFFLTFTFVVLQFIATMTNGSADLFAISRVFIVPTLFVAFISVRVSARGIRIFLDGVVAYAVVQVLISILELMKLASAPFGNANVNGVSLYHPIITTLVRVQGTVGHPILLGLLIGTAIMITITRPGKLGLGKVLIIVSLGAGFYLTGSRSAWLATLASLALFFVFSMGTALVRVLAVLVMTVIFILGQLDGRVGDFLNGQWTLLSESGSFTHRAATIDLFGQIAGGVPTNQLLFGSGIGSEHKLFDAGLLQQDGFLVIDNQFLTTFVTVGAIGLGLVMVMLATGILTLPRSAKYAFIALCFLFLSFDLLRWAGPLLLFFIILGFAGEAIRTASRSPQVQPPQAGLLASGRHSQPPA